MLKLRKRGSIHESLCFKLLGVPDDMKNGSANDEPLVISQRYFFIEKVRKL